MSHYRFKILLAIAFLTFLVGCSRNVRKHLNEKTFRSGDITVKWYHISEITTVHDFVELERWGWTKTLMEANTGGIHDIIIKGDTITIRTMSNLLIYELTAKTLNCQIVQDPTVTFYEYEKKQAHFNLNYNRDEGIADSSLYQKGN